MPDNVVGYAVLQVVPSFQGFSGNLAGQISKPLNTAATSASKSSGSLAGKFFGSSFAKELGAASVVGLVVASFKGLFDIGKINDEVSEQIAVGTGKSGAALEGLVGVAHQVSLQVPASLQAISPVVVDLNDKLGLTGPTLQTVTKEVLELGRIQKTTINVADLASTLAGFNVTGKDTPGVLNDIFRISQATDIPVNTLTGSLKTQGAILTSLGFSLKGATSFVASLSKAGVNGSTIVRSLGSALSKLATDGEAPQVTFQRVVASIQSYITTGNEAAALQLSAKVFGTRGATGFVAALKSGKVSIADLTGSVDVSNQSILGMGASTEHLTEDIQLIKNKGVDELTPAADKLFALLNTGFANATAWITSLPPLSVVFAPLIPILDPIATSLKNIVDQIPPLSVGIIGIAGAFAKAVSAIGVSALQLLPGVFNLISKALTIANPLLQDLSSWLNQNEGLVIAVVIAFYSWRTITTIMAAVTAAQTAFTVASYGAEAATYASAAAGRVAALAAKAGAAAQALQSSALVKSIAGWIANTAAVLDNEALTNTSKIAIIASSVAMGVATAAQWLWNVAMDANPIGLIILAVVALVAGIIFLATKTTFFQTVWKDVTTAIGVAWNWLWKSVLKPVFDAIGAAFTWIYNYIIKPVVLGISIYISIWIAIFQLLWKYVLLPFFTWLGAIFTWIYKNIIQPIVAGISLEIQAWGAIFNWLWLNVLSPVFTAMGAIFNWIYTNVILPVVNFISLAIRGLGLEFTWLHDNIIAPVFAAIGAVFNWIWVNVIKPVFDLISNATTGTGNTVQSIFGGIGTFIGNAFTSAAKLVKTPINAIIDLVNGLIESIDKIKVTLPAVGTFKGGVIGFNIPKLPRLAAGARVKARDGGTPVILGEGGTDETVVDSGLMNAALAELENKTAGMPEKLELYDVDNKLIGTMDVRAAKAVDDADAADDSTAKGRPVK